MYHTYYVDSGTKREAFTKPNRARPGGLRRNTYRAMSAPGSSGRAWMHGPARWLLGGPSQIVALPQPCVPNGHDTCTVARNKRRRERRKRERLSLDSPFHAACCATLHSWETEAKQNTTSCTKYFKEWSPPCGKLCIWLKYDTTTCIVTLRQSTPPVHVNDVHVHYDFSVYLEKLKVSVPYCCFSIAPLHCLVLRTKSYIRLLDITIDLDQHMLR